MSHIVSNIVSLSDKLRMFSHIHKVQKQISNRVSSLMFDSLDNSIVQHL